ncbi:MAG: copper chaperone PCu(A)C [Proteobacteria bacterium]|nr:copper chaperone PCu(A)C [Pseudomonadota bacterium]
MAALTLFALLANPQVRAESAAESAIMVTEPWVREAPPNMTVHAAYGVLHNKTAKPAQLVSAMSPDYKTVELHLSKVEHGMATMVKQDQLSIPANGMVTMAPGGFHLMLHRPKRALKAGDKITITLGFADGLKTVFSAPVKKGAGVAAMNHHKGH